MRMGDNLIRFDEATGTLEGTTLPAIPDLLPVMVERGWRGKQGCTFHPMPGGGIYGCPMGFAAMLRPPVENPSYDPDDFNMAAGQLGMAGDDGDASDVATAIASGFDNGDCEPVSIIKGEEEDHAYAYGRAAYKAMESAGLMVP